MDSRRGFPPPAVARLVSSVILLMPILLLAPLARAQERPATATEAVAAYLDPLYSAIAARVPNPAALRPAGLVKHPPPIVDDDYNRNKYRIASALSQALRYDFVKLAVIDEYTRTAKTPRGGIAVTYGIDAVIDGLPNGEPGVAEARRIGDLIWLCRHPFLTTYTAREIFARTDAYLQKVIPPGASNSARAQAVLDAFEDACTVGVPRAEWKPIRPTMRTTMFEVAGKIADLIGLPFERLARVESGNGPLVLYSLVRALPADHQGRKEALAVLSADDAGRLWTR